MTESIADDVAPAVGPGSPLGAPRVSFAGVGIRYYTRRDGKYFNAVKDVTFDIHQDELICVVGPSGCGKSTVLGAVAGLLPYHRGTITVAGKRVDGPGTDRAVVFQKPALLPWRSVIDNVAYGMKLRGVNKREALDRAEEMLELVGLSDFARSYPYELSGGMQQRANLARALASNPEILLLDEPFASLDAQHREILQGELLRIWQTTSKSGLFITHQIDEAVLLGDRVIVMSRGPGSVIQADLTIDLPRPRDRSVRTDPRFVAYVEEIWGHLQFDVRR